MEMGFLTRVPISWRKQHLNETFFFVHQRLSNAIGFGEQQAAELGFRLQSHLPSIYKIVAFLENQVLIKTVQKYFVFIYK